MKKKDTVFACLFLASFLICGIWIAGKSTGLLPQRSDYPREDTEDAAHESAGQASEEATDNTTQESPEESADNTTQESPESPADNTTQEFPENPADNTTQESPDQSTEHSGQQAPAQPETVGYEYFEDALFIGDSRTVGILEYGNIQGATFFASSGMSVFNLEREKIAYPNEGRLSFDEVLTRKQYGKIYLMLGINELGYQFESIEKKYKEIVDKIRENQQDAILYLCANMHVTKDQSQKDPIYNNENVNRVNEMISNLADAEDLIYIDANELFDDSEGNLSAEYSSDAFHVYGKYYKDWVDWLRTKGVVSQPLAN